MLNQDRAETSKEQEGRKPAHVKWDGRTIALGTFPASEAAEKCKKAKAFTRMLRTTMSPKPNLAWVKRNLEMLKLRMVNDRPGRRRKSEILERRDHHITSPNQAYYPLSQGLNERGHVVLDFPQQHNLQVPNDQRMRSVGARPASGGGIPDLPFPRSTIDTNFARRMTSTMTSHGNTNAPRRFENYLAQNNMFSSTTSQNQPRDLAPLANSSWSSSTSSPLPHHLSGNPRELYQMINEHHRNLEAELRQTSYYLRGMYLGDHDGNDMRHQGMTNHNRVAGDPTSPRRSSLPFGNAMNNNWNSSGTYDPFRPNERRSSL